EGLAFLKLVAYDYEGAHQEYRKLVEDDPNFYKGYTALGRCYAQQGNYLDAIRMLEKGRAMAGDVPNIIAAMGQVYGLGGEPARAREVLAKLAHLARTSYIPSTSFAIVHLGLCEHDRALDWLEKGLTLHDPPLTVLKVHP